MNFFRASCVFSVQWSGDKDLQRSFQLEATGEDWGRGSLLDHRRIDKHYSFRRKSKKLSLKKFVISKWKERGQRFYIHVHTELFRCGHLLSENEILMVELVRNLIFWRHWLEVRGRLWDCWGLFNTLGARSLSFNVSLAVWMHIFFL